MTEERRASNRLQDLRELLISTSWGFAEATFFIIIPDVYLTYVSARDLRRGLISSFACLCGALVGGVLLFLLGTAYPESTIHVLSYIPTVDQESIQLVQRQMRSGPVSILNGPIRGVPYKLYAATAGAQSVSFSLFLVMSMLSRYGRFFLSTVIAGAIGSVIRSNEVMGQKGLSYLVVAFWVLLYVTLLGVNYVNV